MPGATSRLAVLNFAYVAAAVAGAWLMRRRIKYLALLLTYPVVRSLFLATIGQSEDRYTMECFPFVLVLAAVFLAWWQAETNHSEPITVRALQTQQGRSMSPGLDKFERCC